MILRIAALGALLLAGSLVADDDASRAKLMGSWQSAEGAKETAVVWSFQEKADMLHIAHSVAGRPIAEFDCDSFGHECNIKDGGRPAKVSWWYNGPKLVEMETKGNFVWKRSFEVTGEGDTMQLEQVQIAPSSKTEILKFKRIPAAAETK